MHIKTSYLLTAALLTAAMGASAQPAETLTVATLNVDGLPLNILGVEINADGPGSAGSSRIGEYLKDKGYDIIMMQEDFNFHEEIKAPLDADYGLDEWSGGIEVDEADFMYWLTHRFTCDGLMAAWKTGTVTLSETEPERTAWTANYGRFDHALDEMATKGFRRYEMRLQTGTEIVAYNMHMDAEENADTQSGNATGDRLARQEQWKQLRDDIMEKLDGRPVLVMGDMNSLYFRDPIEEEFVNAIEETGKATVADSWVILVNDGKYPEYKENDTTPEYDAPGGEMLDKILCVNPTEGKSLLPIAYSLDSEGYAYEGKQLGDHLPVAVTLEVVETKTGIVTIKKENENFSAMALQRKGQGKENESKNENLKTWYTDLQGRPVSGTPKQKGIYISNGKVIGRTAGATLANGKKIFCKY